MKKVLRFLKYLCIRVFRSSKSLIIYLIKYYIDKLVIELKKKIEEDMTEKQINELIDMYIEKAVMEISAKYPFASAIAKVILQGFADYLKMQLKQRGQLTVAECMDIVAEVIKGRIAEKIKTM